MDAIQGFFLLLGCFPLLLHDCFSRDDSQAVTVCIFSCHFCNSTSSCHAAELLLSNMIRAFYLRPCCLIVVELVEWLLPPVDKAVEAKLKHSVPQGLGPRGPRER